MRQLALAALVLLGGLALEPLIGPYPMRLVIFALIYALLALGLNFTVGLRGELSLGHATFFGVGAYSSALASLRAGLPLMAAIPISALVTAVIGAAVGVIALRMRGPYFVIVTLSFASIAHLLALNMIPITNGPMGLAGVGAGASGLLGVPLGLPSNLFFYELLALLVLLSCAATARLMNSRYGRAWASLQQNEELAAALGIRAFRLDMLSFVWGAVICGVAGSVYAYYTSLVSPDVLTFHFTIIMLVSLVLGGKGTVLGAFVFSVVPEYLRVAEGWRLPIFGLLLMVLVIAMPNGMVPLLKRLASRVELPPSWRPPGQPRKKAERTS